MMKQHRAKVPPVPKHRASATGGQPCILPRCKFVRKLERSREQGSCRGVWPLREYTLTETYHEDDVEMEFVSNDNLLANSPTPRGIDPNRDLNEAIAEERKEMDTQRYRDSRSRCQGLVKLFRNRYWTTTGSGQMVTDFPRDNKAAIMDSIASAYALQRPRYNATPPPKMTKLDGRTGWLHYQKYKQAAEAQKAQIFADIQRKMANATSGNSLGHSWNSTDNTTQRQHRLRMKHHRLTSKGKRLRTRPPRDCKVSEWGPWSACSRSCGVGETQRTRKITIKPRRGGSSCPPLKETKWCGSASPCSDGKPIADSYKWAHPPVVCTDWHPGRLRSTDPRIAPDASPAREPPEISMHDEIDSGRNECRRRVVRMTYEAWSCRVHGKYVA
ncbi:Thrombospondin type-1 domain-containing protein 7A [Eufriesea mexicana]|uniref:Thrombospondin type-1 domain-containing protein 7A n=1 Tax=Eufriesea mexicana TaxID=516756 RepID=A0A310SCV4_9HYME|nr:Thrombospondin type-1 domain-containing protein 7A [Eufriesea mexicana]